MNVKDLEEIAEFCKKNRVRVFKGEGFTMEFELPPTDDQAKATAEIAEIMKKEKTVTDDDLLMDPYAGLDEE